MKSNTIAKMQIVKEEHERKLFSISSWEISAWKNISSNPSNQLFSNLVELLLSRNLPKMRDATLQNATSNVTNFFMSLYTAKWNSVKMSCCALKVWCDKVS